MVQPPTPGQMPPPYHPPPRPSSDGSKIVIIVVLVVVGLFVVVIGAAALVGFFVFRSTQAEHKARVEQQQQEAERQEQEARARAEKDLERDLEREQGAVGDVGEKLRKLEELTSELGKATDPAERERIQREIERVTGRRLPPPNPKCKPNDPLCSEL